MSKADRSEKVRKAGKSAKAVERLGAGGSVEGEEPVEAAKAAKPGKAVGARTSAGLARVREPATAKPGAARREPRPAPAAYVPFLVPRAALRRRGWTEAGIGRFLGVADAQAPNPVFRSAHPMRLFDLARVEGVEATEEWLAWRAESEQRRNGARGRPRTGASGGRSAGR
ncbi:hypothetical protein [Yinghuangia seranimata]|uniref:hypothetical protein n=1 Tax=Yinghuangia seranimata TaxID=408067 RepID=UPI00248D2B7F|nr:hypothetical protein [Yinghuangia seranimata]MDI2132124.1 hypothetical protein [Yinghuangia seranimata]